MTASLFTALTVYTPRPVS